MFRNVPQRRAPQIRAKCWFFECFLGLGKDVRGGVPAGQGGGAAEERKKQIRPPLFVDFVALTSSISSPQHSRFPRRGRCRPQRNKKLSRRIMLCYGCETNVPQPCDYRATFVRLLCYKRENSVPRLWYNIIRRERRICGGRNQHRLSPKTTFLHTNIFFARTHNARSNYFY